MLSVEDHRIVLLFKERLLQSGVPLVSVRVYGSRARGDCRQDSDLDLCLILSEVDADFLALIGQMAWEVGFENDRIITTVEYTLMQWSQSPLRESPFLKAVEREGVAV